MAKQAIYFLQLTDDQMNGDQGYRVEMSYGVFTVTPKHTKSGVYWYAYKRRRGTLYKTYLGKQGRIRHNTLHTKCFHLACKAGLI